MLGQYLKKYRLEHNLTQAKMAEKLGTSQCYYSLLETNSLKPGFKLIDRIAQLLNQDASFIRSLL